MTPLKVRKENTAKIQDCNVDLLQEIADRTGMTNFDSIVNLCVTLGADVLSKLVDGELTTVSKPNKKEPATSPQPTPTVTEEIEETAVITSDVPSPSLLQEPEPLAEAEKRIKKMFPFLSNHLGF